MKIRLTLIVLLGILLPNVINSQWIQQGSKLTASDAASDSNQGISVAISSDGSTLIEGGWHDNNLIGAAWIFIRNGSAWVQQGTKLVGTGSVEFPEQGFSVAISLDGNTAVIGGNGDNNSVGAIWVFTRNGGVWIQQGSKLVGTGSSGHSAQGSSVAISSDGNTIIEGGAGDTGTFLDAIGAIWIFTRSNGIWTQQGSKIVGTGAVGNGRQGRSVAISSDGNTVIEGGYADNNKIGAVWVFTRSGGIWTQQGTKLVGAGFIGTQIYQGFSISLSGDGNTFVEGGESDNNNAGAIWIFTRSNGIWTQQGSKLIGTGAAGNAYQGSSVTISANGNVLVEGGNYDNNNGTRGAIWIFLRNGTVWTQQAQKIIGTGGVGNSQQGTSVAISTDGNTVIDGGYQDNNGLGAIWAFYNPLIGIQPISSEISNTFSLSQNYPNPFNPSTKIRFAIPGSSVAQTFLSVYDVLGKEVAKLVNEKLKPGIYSVDWNAANYPSGIYFYRITAGDFADTKKMILTK